MRDPMPKLILLLSLLLCSCTTSPFAREESESTAPRLDTPSASWRTGMPSGKKEGICILQRVFHTYRDDFPLLRNKRPTGPAAEDMLDGLMTRLILDLSDLATLPRLTYITRHTDDTIPSERLAPFLVKFHDIVDTLGEHQQYGIPTVWFVGHFANDDEIARIRQELDRKNIKYFETGGEYANFQQLNQIYWENKNDAEPFLTFLHQVTMIGIDLLSTGECKQTLEQLGRLEYMQYTDIENMKSDLKEMQRYLREKSSFYRGHIVHDAIAYREFWENFTKWKKSEAVLTSWPHFLFNLCGISHPVEHLPLRVRTETLFEGWW